jgi:hypothetical protein
MLTTAGVTSLSIGASDGRSVSKNGSCASAVLEPIKKTRARSFVVLVNIESSPQVSDRSFIGRGCTDFKLEYNS